MTDLGCDIVVAGGGMVGACAAVALARAGFTVAMADGRRPETEWPAGGFDLRVSAITRASQHIFANLGVWPAMTAERVTPYRRMLVWEDEPRHGVRFDAESLGQPDLGHIVENRVIVKALWARLHEQSGVRIHAPAELEAVADDGDGLRVRLSDGVQLRTHLLIGADGAGSQVRQLADIAVSGHSYHQHAVVTTVRPADGHDETAWQRFLPTGPLALLPLGSAHCSIVWSTTESEAQRLSAADDAELGDALTAATQGRLGPIAVAGARGRFPLKLQRAQTYIAPGIALIGDAAHVVHPLAGQGVNLGLLDAAVLAGVLAEARSRDRPIGAVATLRRYERARKADNLLMQYGMDGFKHLFGFGAAPVRAARGLGLRLVDRSHVAKRVFAAIAQGGLAEATPLTRPPQEIT